MTVRWKPLIVLSGLFLIIAVLGLMAITFELVPSRASDILPAARTQWKAGRYKVAKIHFLRALQKEPRNADIHTEYAQMLGEWGTREPAERLTLRAERLRELADAAKYGKQAEGPRRLLLEDALRNEEPAERWAKELLGLNATNADAHYALALEALDATPPDPTEARTHLDALDTREPSRLRTAWLRARLAQALNDDAAVAQVLTSVRDLAPTIAELDALDRMALLRLRQMDALATTDPDTLATRIRAVETVARAMAADPSIPPERLARLGRMLEEVPKQLRRLSSTGQDAARLAEATKASSALEQVAESTYAKALESAHAADLRVYLEYAEHLMFREKRQACLDLVIKALKQSVASSAAWADTTAQLREIAIKAALSDTKDKDRYAKAEPFIKDLVDSTARRDQALGHLFRGVIDLERSGLADAARGPNSAAAKTDAKVRSSALAHLKLAADGLPEIPTAQALYGIALLLSGEPALGRQYLQTAQRMPNIDPQYRVWAAWAMVQAGYPEEAEPVVTDLLEGVAQGKQSHTLEPTLHVLMGEIHQARRTPEELKRAREEYQKALATGQRDTPEIQLRLAQLDLLLGDRAAGVQRIEKLKGTQGGVAAEHLAILALSDQGKSDEARSLLANARKRYPESVELVGLDVSLHLRDQQPAKADAVLADFLKSHPKDLDAIQMRARLLAGTLKKPEQARALLVAAAEGAETSGPLVQLALLDLGQNDHEAVARTIKQIRNRWKEAAAADLLDAQLAMFKNQPRAAAGFLEAALKKDPGNKVALFWKAQLDDRNGSSAEAARVFEEIVKEKPVKELDEGLSLTTAAHWALATMALENQDADEAIVRLEAMLKGGDSPDMARAVRWQLAAARDAKGQWPAARAEIEALLKDPKVKATTLERVRAANFYRVHGEVAAAAAQLDLVLKAEPGYTPAIALRAYLLAEKAPDQASALIRKAMAGQKQPAALYLMLAAIENVTPPAKTGLARAQAVVDKGLTEFPDSIELAQAKYRILRLQNDPKGALAFVVAKAKNDPKGQFRRYLVDIHRDEGRYDEAEQTVLGLLKETPDDTQLATMEVRLAALAANAASGRGDRAGEKACLDRAAGLIAKYRKRFPNEPSFLQAECELAARAGKLDRAIELTHEIDTADKASPTGPLLRAQIAATQGATQEVASEYADAVARAPRRADLRLAFGQASLAVGKHDEALKQANWLLDSSNAEPAATLLKARALAEQDGPSSEVEARRAEAIRILRALLAKQATYSPAYHLIAEIQMMGHARRDAVATLSKGLKVVPNDTGGLSLLVQIMTELRENGAPPDIEEAKEVAARAGGQKDVSGEVLQALASGFHRAGQYDLALPWAEKAAASLDTWVTHLSLGDILLSKAEATADPTAARVLFGRAVEQYDRVLKVQADSVEAINNKAWILHEYLEKDADALELAQGLTRRVDPSRLPAEFHDTLGAIQEALHQSKAAEASYESGLRKAPDHPILNFHLGRLILSDPDRAVEALPYLKKAQAARGQLPPRFAAELTGLMAKAGE
jgi:predicted Zn-dependent protease